MNKLILALVLSIPGIIQAKEVQNISLSECLAIEKERPNHLIWAGPFKGATRTNGMIYTLNCGPRSTITWETPEQYLQRVGVSK